jgi:hypothetical protein
MYQTKEVPLLQNYSNPFNPTSSISYLIPQAVYVTLKVFDVLGREVTTLVNEFKQEGNYNSQFKTCPPVGKVLNYPAEYISINSMLENISRQRKWF